MALTDAVVHEQVTRQERSHHQAGPIAQPCLGLELAHPRVDDGDARLALAPRFDGLWIVLLGTEDRGESIVGASVSLRSAMEELVVVELTPGELPHVGRRGRTGRVDRGLDLSR